MKPVSAIVTCVVTTVWWALGAPAYAEVQAGPGRWSSEQTWATDPNHGGALKGFYYWPRNPPRLAGKRALILVLHGCAQTASGDVISSTSDDGFNWPTTAEKYGAVIVVPNATGDVAGHHCWDYYGTSHTKTSGHVGVLLDVVERFKDDPEFAIDPDQVYVAGLSSGGGEVMVLGCIAPDVFAGLGNNAGPSLGTGKFQIGSVPSGYNASSAAQNCRAIAPGASDDHFATQIFSEIYGKPNTWSQFNRSDGLVSTDYARINGEATRSVYGATFTRLPDFVVPGASGDGRGQQWADEHGKTPGLIDTLRR